MSYDEWKCPDCEGPMVARKGSYGIFWGCKSYPICKGTRDANGLSKADRAKARGETYEHDEHDVTNRFSFKRTN